MVRLFAFRISALVSTLAAIVGTAAVVATPTPAAARVDISIGLNVGGIGFGYFHQNLGRRGHWIHHPRWGDVWQPPHALSYRPYYNGYWEYSDYGLLWVSNDPWGSITEHYGRWIRDPHYGWLWIPGYVWGPGWVVWREGAGYFGWMPMPPDYGDFDDGPYFGGNYGWNDYYGYGDWYGLNRDAFFGLWIFVDQDHFYRRDYRKYSFHDSKRIRNIINRTSDATNYSTSGDHIVNRSITVDKLERITHQSIKPVDARKVMKSDVPMAPVSAGRGLARQEGSGRPGPHLHDNNFKPMIAPQGNQTPPNKGPGLTDHEGAKGKEVAPALQPRSNAAEENTAGTKRGGKNEAAPAPQPMPNAGEEKTGGMKRGEKNEATPATQPMPNAGEEKTGGMKRGEKNEAMPAPQPTPNAGEESGRGNKPGGKSEAAPAPQPRPNGAEERGQQRKPDTAGVKPQGTEAGATTGQETQGRERPKAGEKKKVKEPPAEPNDGKDKKRPSSDENGPGQ